MQGTADFHHDIADTLLPQAYSVCDDTTVFDTAVNMLDPPAVVQHLVSLFLLQHQLLTAGFLGRYRDLDLGDYARQGAQVLQQSTPDR